jgi:hypothetical protein
MGQAMNGAQGFELACVMFFCALAALRGLFQVIASYSRQEKSTGAFLLFGGGMSVVMILVFLQLL